MDYPERETTLHREQKLLEQLRVAASGRVDRTRLPSFVQQSAQITVEDYRTVARLVDGMVIRLRAYVLADKQVDTTREVVLEVPASWWQHFKQDSWLWRHAPKWMRKRWPISYTEHKRTVQFQRYLTYPHAEVPLPSDPFGAPVIYETFSDSGWQD